MLFNATAIACCVDLPGRNPLWSISITSSISLLFTLLVAVFDIIVCNVSHIDSGLYPLIDFLSCPGFGTYIIFFSFIQTACSSWLLKYSYMAFACVFGAIAYISLYIFMVSHGFLNFFRVWILYLFVAPVLCDHLLCWLRCVLLLLFLFYCYFLSVFCIFFQISVVFLCCLVFCLLQWWVFLWLDSSFSALWYPWTLYYFEFWLVFTYLHRSLLHLM